MIKYHKDVPCDWCRKSIPVGAYAYRHEGSTLCEDCMDEVLSDMKDAAAVRVNNDNFELEYEGG